MKRNLGKFIIIFLCIAATCALLCLSASASGSDDVTVEYYGRYALSQMDNSTALLYAYDNIAAGIEASLAEIDVYNENDKISQDEIRAVFEAYRCDHTDHFWLGDGYSMNGTTDTITRIIPQYRYSGSELTEKKAEFEAAVSEMLSGLTANMSEFEKELYLHDELAKKVVYIEDTNAHNAYGALVEGRAVCEGYAEAFQYLLQRAGIQSFVALGASVNPSTGSSEPHGWNIVKIDGKYYHVDLTWNDQTAHTYHAYFNLSDTAILTDHAIDQTAYALPVCNSSDAFYFNVKGGIIDGITDGTSEMIAQLLSENGFTAGVYVTGSKDIFLDWLSNNIYTIGDLSGAEGIRSYGYSALSNEVHIKVNTCSHESLTHITPVEATCKQGGNIDYYTCSCGVWFYDAQAQSVINNHASVLTVGGHDYSEKLTNDAHLKTEGNCQSKSVYWYDCSRCDTIAKDDPAAQDKYYTGNTYGEHDADTAWTSENGKHFHKCLVDGCDYEADSATCSGGSSDCQTLATCSVCKKNYGELGDHLFDLSLYNYKSEYGHGYACKTAGCESHTQLEPHLPGPEATKLTPQLCLECGYIVTPALDHKHSAKEEWLHNSTYHWHGCNGCEEYLNKAEHSFDNVCDGLCDLCGYERITSGHADADSDGKCDACGYGENTSTHTDKRPDETKAPEITAPTTKIDLGLGCRGAIGGTALILPALLTLCALSLKKKKDE